MSAMTSTRASPSNLDWYTTSASKLGENGVLPSLPRRAVCTCKSAGKRQNSISQVVLVEGISIPKCLGMLVIPSRSRGPSPKATSIKPHVGVALSPCATSRPNENLLQLAWKLDPQSTGVLGCASPHGIAAVLASNLSDQGKA